ncbi:MAG: Lrp/AsnC family transcriptional regulator [Candidatus Nanopelagicales bacterium]
MSQTAPVQLDDVNRAIVHLLQEDGRRSFADIAKRVNRSEASVRQRVGRLMRSGVIQIVAITDQLQMGYQRAAMIAIRVDGDIEVAARQIGEIDEVDYLVATAGGVDLFAEVVAVDDQNLYNVVTRIRAVPGVRHAESYVYFKLHKQTYQWGAR